jgi:hypothetical protein
VWSLPRQAKCALTCAPDPQRRLLLFDKCVRNVRSPYAFIGGRGLRDSQPGDWHPLFGLDVGHPLGLCAETAPGSQVFERRWSEGVASLDCKTYKGSLPFEMLPDSELYF